MIIMRIMIYAKSSLISIDICPRLAIFIFFKMQSVRQMQFINASVNTSQNNAAVCSGFEKILNETDYSQCDTMLWDQLALPPL